MFDGMQNLPIKYFDTHKHGDIMSRYTNDIDAIRQLISQAIPTTLQCAILLCSVFFIMLYYSVWLTLVVLAGVFMIFLVTKKVGGGSAKYFIRQQKHLGELNGHIEEIYTGHTVVKAYNGEADAQKTFDEMNENLRISGFRAQCLSGLMHPLMGFIGNFGYVAVCVVGAVLTMNDKISFGVIVAFMMYVRLFTQPLSQMAQGMQSLQSAAAAGSRVFEFLEAEEMVDESAKSTRTDEIKGEVEFKHVSFGYEDSDKTIIHDFSAKAMPSSV